MMVDIKKALSGEACYVATLWASKVVDPGATVVMVGDATSRAQKGFEELVEAGYLVCSTGKDTIYTPVRRAKLKALAKRCYDDLQLGGLESFPLVNRKDVKKL